MSRFADRLLDWLSPPAALLGESEDPHVAEARIRREVRAIEIRARTALRERMAGDFRSAFRGRGLEFASIRAYTPGDEVRLIDWNVTARRGAPYVKEFVEERERTLLIVIDFSPSGAFGTTGRSVRRFAVEVAGLLGFSAAASNDRVGAIAFSDRTEYLLQPARGDAHVLRLLHDLLHLRPRGGGSDLGGALEHAARTLRGGSIVAVISDFQGDAGEAGDWQPALRRLAVAHDVLALHVHDPAQARLPDDGLLTIEDAESGRVVTVDPAAIGDDFAREDARRGRAVRRLLRGAGADYLSLPSDAPAAPALARLFRLRTQRR
ncbi:MAG: DUF58 domain-containing protein [Chloroflexota bacterium]|nr:DUF58 domain-containing protein [Chloroflexota bacterium]